MERHPEHCARSVALCGHAGEGHSVWGMQVGLSKPPESVIGGLGRLRLERSGAAVGWGGVGWGGVGWGLLALACACCLGVLCVSVPTAFMWVPGLGSSVILRGAKGSKRQLPLLTNLFI